VPSASISPITTFVDDPEGWLGYLDRRLRTSVAARWQTAELVVVCSYRADSAAIEVAETLKGEMISEPIKLSLPGPEGTDAYPSVLVPGDGDLTLAFLADIGVDGGWPAPERTGLPWSRPHNPIDSRRSCRPPGGAPPYPRTGRCELGLSAPPSRTRIPRLAVVNAPSVEPLLPPPGRSPLVGETTPGEHDDRYCEHPQHIREVSDAGRFRSSGITPSLWSC
jgi:hypothetical protein